MATARAGRTPPPDVAAADGAPDSGPTEVALPEHLRGRAPIPPAPPPGQEVLSTRDLAGLMMVPVPTIQRLYRTTDLPGRFVGRELRFVRSDILRWISAGSKTDRSTSENPLAEGVEEDMPTADDDE